MIKNNITLSVNIEGYNELLDYDKDTAIGLNFRAYQIENIGELMLDYTRTFTLPKTARNNLIFSHINSVHSVSSFPYKSNTMKIAVNGVLVMEGTMSIQSVADRYNVQLVVYAGVFNVLKKLPFVAMHSDKYPISLASMIKTYWEDNVRQAIRSTYAPTHYDEWLNAVVDYCTKKDTSTSNPANAFIIPTVLNQFADNLGYYDEDDNFTTESNNIFATTGNRQGLYIAQSFPYVDGLEIKRYRNVLISPLWCRLDVVLSLIEQYLAENGESYSFGNLYDTIKEIIGRELYVHIPGIEFEYELTRDGVIKFFGHTKIIKGGDGVYGCKFEGGSISDLSQDDFPSINCCDILKTLINDFALVFDVDKANKTFTFGKLNDIMSSNVYELRLVKNNSKSFYIDNFKQNQSIVYDNDDKNKNAGSYLVKCENQNIEEGKETDELFKIDRTIFYSSMYKSGTMRGGKYIYSNVPNLMSNDTEKKLMYTTATVSPVGGDIRYFIATCEQNADRASEYKRVYLKNTVNTSNVITKIEQPTVGASLVYSILNEIVRTPIRYEVEVDMNAKLLYNFKHFAICRVDGLVGYYYIQSINDFNPRTDNTMTLTLIKLPPVVVDVFKAIITENDIELITENDIQVITEDSKN